MVFFSPNERDKKCMNEIAAILRSKGIFANPHVCTSDMKMCTVTPIYTVLSNTWKWNILPFLVAQKFSKMSNFLKLYSIKKKHILPICPF